MTVPVPGMGALHPTKRLPSPAVHSQSAPSATSTFSFSSKLRSHRCYPRLTRIFRPPNLYRTLTVIVLLATVVFLFAHYSIPHPTEPSLPLLHFNLSLQHVRRMARRALRLYQRQLHLHPLVSRAITAGVIFFIADLLAQGLNRRTQGRKPPTFSFTRLARYSVYGLMAMGPFLYLWYALMNEYGPEDDLKGSLLKCLFEQITLEPICICMYIIYDGIICRRGMRAVRNSLDAQFFPLWFKNAVFWLPANFANYYIGTPDLRVVFANLCSLFWNIYFSSKVNKIAVPSFVADKNPKYLPLSNHDRESSVVSTSGAYQKPNDGYIRRAGDTVSSSRIPTLIV